MKTSNFLIGKNIHSVLTVCPQCAGHGVNLPGNTKCANCDYWDCVTYYDYKTIDKYLMPKKNHHGGKRKNSGRKKGVKFKEPTVVKRIPISKIEEVQNLLNKKIK